MDNFSSLKTYKDIVTILNEARSATTFAKALEVSLGLYLSFTKFDGGVIKIETSTSTSDITCEISKGAARVCPEAIDLPDCLCGNTFSSESPNILAAPVLKSTMCGKEGFISGVCAPLATGGAKPGLFLALSKNSKQPSDEVLAMTELFCQHISETVNRLNESARAEKRAIDLATVSNIGRLMIARLTLKEMVEEIIAQLGGVLETDEINVILYNDEKKELSFLARYFTGDIKAESLETRPLSDGINSWIIKNRTPLLMSYDTEEECKKLGIRHGGRPAKSWLGAPMIYKDKVTGVLSVQSYTKTGLYDDLSIELLTIVASQCAVAVENAKLFEEATFREEEKEKLYFSLTHDLLALVNPVSGFARLLKSLPEGTSRERYISLANSMITASENITRFVEDVLVWGKIREGQLTLNIARANVIDVIRSTLHTNMPELVMRKIKVTVNKEPFSEDDEISAAAVEADFDVAQLERVFLNLIGNAVKHARSHIDLTAGIEDGGVFCRIRDDGDGVPANQLKFVFDEFYQAGAKRKGVGLGLPTVKKIVELHHGAIMVDSDVGKGFMVEFSWPRTLADRSFMEVDAVTGKRG